MRFIAPFASLRALLIAAILTANAASGAHAASDTRPQIAITAIVRHATIDVMIQGIEDALSAAGLVPGDDVAISFDSARANLERADDIARSLQQRDVSLIVALSEPSARIVAAKHYRTPIVIAGLTVAKADAIVAERRTRLLTGIGNGDADDALIDLVAVIRPAAKRVLTPLFVPEDEAAATLRPLVAAARTKPFAIEPYPVADGAAGDALLPAATNTASDIIFLSRALVGDHADAVIHEATRRGLPIVADSRDLVVRGATATIILDNYAVGRQVGDLAAAILRDPSLARQPIRRAEARYLIVNGEAATDPRLGLAVNLTDIANEVIEWAEPGGPRPVFKPLAPPSATSESQLNQAPTRSSSGNSAGSANR